MGNKVRDEMLEHVWAVKMDFDQGKFEVALFTTWELAKEFMRHVVFEQFEREYKNRAEQFDLPAFPESLEGMTDEMVERFFEIEGEHGDNFYDIVETRVWEDNRWLLF